MKRLSWHASTAKGALEGLMDQIIDRTLQPDIKTIGLRDLGLICGVDLGEDIYNQAQESLTPYGFEVLRKDDLGNPASPHIYAIFAKVLTPAVRETGSRSGW